MYEWFINGGAFMGPILFANISAVILMIVLSRDRSAERSKANRRAILVIALIPLILGAIGHYIAYTQSMSYLLSVDPEKRDEIHQAMMSMAAIPSIFGGVSALLLLLLGVLRIRKLTASVANALHARAEKSPEEISTRPISITFICVINVVGTLSTVPLTFLPTVTQLGSWYPPYMAFEIVVVLACMVGLWMMKKWAVYVYMGVTILTQFVLQNAGAWEIVALLGPAVVIFFSLTNISKMS